jgi:hypothetical protein
MVYSRKIFLCLVRIGAKHENLNLSVGFVANASAVCGHANDVQALCFTYHRAGGHKCSAIQGLVF